MTARAIRLTPKELARASGGYTVAVRPQARGHIAAAVRVEDGRVVFAEKASTRECIGTAAREVLRWLDKLGAPCPMAAASRHRRT